MDAKEQCRVIMMVTPVDDNDSLFAIAQKDIKVLCAVAEKVTLVSGCIPDWVPLPSNCTVVDFNRKLHYVKQRSPLWLSIFSQLLKILFIQLRMSAEIIKLRKRTDVVFCYLGYHYLVPVAIAKICGLKVISGAWGVSDNAIRNYGWVLGQALKLGLDAVYLLSDLIVVQSSAIASHPFLRRWENKMKLGAQYFGDENFFRALVPVNQRRLIVGFVGRLSPEKGIMEFMNSIPMIVKHNQNINFEIIGRGTCEEAINALIRECDLEEHVSIHGSIANLDLSNYYNNFRLLVIPSFSEGLPNVLLEALSTGTPVLATSVGAISEILEEDKTGFILLDNSPEEIARRILEIIEQPDRLLRVARNARIALEEKYSFAAAVLRFQAIFDSL